MAALKNALETVLPALTDSKEDHPNWGWSSTPSSGELLRQQLTRLFDDGLASGIVRAIEGASPGQQQKNLLAVRPFSKGCFSPGKRFRRWLFAKLCPYTLSSVFSRSRDRLDLC